MSITAPIGPLVAQSAALKALIGADPVRFWEFSEAERDAQGNVSAPYIVWQTVYGGPENFLAGRPREDRWGVQLDVYANSGGEARQIAELLRSLIELQSHIVAYNGESKDYPTNLFRYSFTTEWLTDR